MNTRIDCSIITIIPNISFIPSGIWNGIHSVGGGDFSTTGVVKRPSPSNELRVRFSISLTSETKNKKRKDLIARSKDIPSNTYFPGNGARNSLMSTHASILVDYVGPPSAEVCRTSTISPQVDDLRFIELREV